MADKLEIKILTDPEGHNIDLSNLSAASMRTFLVLAESLTEILENTENKEQLTIQISKGSAVIAVKGDIAHVVADYKEVISAKSNKDSIVDPWRKIQSVFSQNGFLYSGEFIVKQKRTSFYESLKSAKKIRKPRSRKMVTPDLIFVDGELSAVGGKSPNIHVDDESGKRLIISCRRDQAIKARAFLYDRILLSAWVKTIGHQKTYDLCDTYFIQQYGIFDELKNFVYEYNVGTEIETLKKVHFKCRNYLEEKDYSGLRKFLRLFIHESTDGNILKTLLIVTSEFNNDEKIVESRNMIKAIFDKKFPIKLNTNKPRDGASNFKSK